MKIAVFSDSHGSAGRMAEILSKNSVDLVFHLGDLIKDALRLQEAFPGIPVFCVKGNNDFLRDEPAVRIEHISEHTFFITHGHQHFFGYGIGVLYQDALDQGADVALFGHTHYPHIEKRGGVLILNPGSITLPRGGNRPSWALITIGDPDPLRAEIMEV